VADLTGERSPLGRKKGGRVGPDRPLSFD
jgi:hypothetical protein